MSALRQPLVCVSGIVGLAACQMLPALEDPEDRVTLLNEVELEDGAPNSALLDQDAPGQGIFASLFGSVLGNEAPVRSTVGPENSATDGVVRTASISTNGISSPANLFGGFFEGSSEPVGPDAAAPLGFGELRKDCGATRNALGTKILSQSGFEVYDTSPGTLAARMHYVTGFSDNCPRAFIGALVMFGDVGTHEVVRYSETRVRLDYSSTDNAYEALKANFCRVRHGQPCGRRLESLGRVTAFLTVYERFGESPEWAEFLLHNGRVTSTALEKL